MSLDVYLSPNKCQHCGRADEGFWQNITHNLNKMADEAGIYGIVWRPEENGITTARQLIEPLRKAIADMKADPERFKKHNASNGWGCTKISFRGLSAIFKRARKCQTQPSVYHGKESP